MGGCQMSVFDLVFSNCCNITSFVSAKEIKETYK